jgi:glycosyltransferase involved in cell wall biosynthesis
VALDRLILLAPIEPAPTGNGLAMRAEVFRRSAPDGADVRTVVVPVAGRLAGAVGARAPVSTVFPDPVLARAGVRALVANPVWRERLKSAGDLPPLARAASPGLAEAVAQACDGPGNVALHTMRCYLAPLGVAVAERLEPDWVTLDLDDDDAAVAASLGDLETATAYERLLSTFGPLFDGLSAASPVEARAMAARHDFEVEHIPNAIDCGEPIAGKPRSSGSGEVSLLLVGNLTYSPNIEAARLLVEAVLPRVRIRLDRPVRLTLVGPHRAEVSRLRGPGIEVAGFVADLRPVYATADAVVVPTSAGGGTRIKLLEAFAHGVPVVASRAAAAGLEIVDKRQFLLADSPDQIAAAIDAIIAESGLASHLIEHAGQFVRERHCAEVVRPRIAEFFALAADRARAQLSMAE